MAIETVSPLPRTWDIPAALRYRLSDRTGRQRAIFEQGHLLLVLHQPPKRDELERRGRFLWRKPDGTWICNEGKSGPGALAQHLDEYSRAIHLYDLQEERAANATAYFDVIDGLSPLLRSTSHLHQVLQEARKLVPEDRILIHCRDQAYELERTVELLYANAKNGLDYEIAKRAEEEARSSRQMARSAHRLNILAAFFFPLATISGVLGIDLDAPWGQFPGVLQPVLLGLVLVGLFAGAVLAWIVSRPGRQP